MSINANTDSSSKKTETSTHANVGPVPEQDPMMKSRNVDYNENINRDINKDYNKDVTNLSETGESKGLVSSVVEAAKSAATRVREAFVGDTEHRSNVYTDDNSRRIHDKEDMHHATSTTSTTEKPTSEKMKDTAYDTKEKIKDTAYDAKEKIKDTSRDIKDKVKDTTYDIKDKSKDASYDMRDKSKDTNYEMREKAKDTGRDVKEKVKDTAYDIKDKAKDTAHDIKDKTKDTNYEIREQAKDLSRDRDIGTHKHRDTSLSADSDIAADSNKQRLRDIKEKVVDAAQAPVAMVQTMFATGKEKLQEAMKRDTTTDTTTKPVSETPGTSDMFSENYQPGPAQYQPSTTEQAKSKLASTTANAADKAETWIAENKPKLNEQANKAQDLAADTKQKANAKAQETGKEPASDTRYYSGVHGQTY